MVEGKAEMGGRAKALYKYFRIRSELFYRLGVTQIYINQLRTALNVGFGKDNTTTTGGAALKFYASIRAAFYSGKSITVKQNGKERKAGKLVTIRLIKIRLLLQDLQSANVRFTSTLNSMKLDLIDAMP